MTNKTPEEKALTKAGRRIAAIFHPSGDKTSFIEHKFSWVLNATDKEFGEFKKTQKDRESLGDIFDDIARELQGDELSNYAREESHQKYFSYAWGGGEQFRKTQRFFASNNEVGEHIIYDGGESTTIFLASGHTTTESIDELKDNLAKFEHYLGLYRASLEYKIKSIEAVVGYVSTVLSGYKGDTVSDAGEKIGYKEYIGELVSGDAQESRVVEKIAEYLQTQELDNPIVLDYVRAATTDAFGPSGFQPKKIVEELNRIKSNTQENASSCGAIIKYCTDTRAHIDRIVQQERQKAGVAQA